MDKVYVFEGKTSTEAIENGLKELKVSKNKVEIKVLESKAKSRIQEEYSWERIADLYEKVFLRLERWMEI